MSISSKVQKKIRKKNNQIFSKAIFYPQNFEKYNILKLIKLIIYF